MIVKCCVCGQQRIGDIWVVTNLTIDEDVSHGYCPTCAEEAYATLRRDQALAKANK